MEISLDPEHFIKFFSELEKIYDDRWNEYKKLDQKSKTNIDQEIKIPAEKTYLDAGFNEFLTRRDPLFDKGERDSMELNLLRGQIEAQTRKSERQHRQKLKNDRINASPQDKYEHALDTIIEKFEFHSQTNNATTITIDYYYFNFEDRMDDSRMLEAYFDKLKEADCFESWGRGNYSGGTKFSFSNVRLDKLREFKRKESEKSSKTTQVKANAPQENDSYEISTRDNKIWVNETYLISKPHGAGSNLEFMLYLLDNSGKEIKRAELPDNIKKEIGNKAFIKILNALGFKGEILKLFFPKRSKIKLLFHKKTNKIELKGRAIRENKLLKELELAHISNNPD